MILTLLAIVFFCGYAALLLFYRRWWRKVPPFTGGLPEDPPRISLLIPARNEAASLPHLLQALDGQTYPKEYFEILVIDDFSTDDTLRIAEAWPLPNLRVLQPEGDPAHSSKKKAVAAGVAAAAGELIVTTDADCLPSPGWLFTLASFYRAKGAAFIAAPVQYTTDGSLLQVFQALDFMTLQGITAASVEGGFHAMCNGANLAYTKEAFEAVSGFEGIDKVASGDDMLLMYKIWVKFPGRVFYLKSREAIVKTEPVKTVGGFISQRKRWGSKTLVYDDKRVLLVLLFVFGINFFFFVLGIAGCFHPFYWMVFLGLLLGKWSVESFFLYPVATFYGARKLMRFFLLFQPLHIFYTVFVGLFSQAGSYEWKGRKTK